MFATGPNADPAARTPGQYARAAVTRLRLRTLVALGVLAVATAELGRTFGLHDARFIASELALLVSMFLISHYVVPLVQRRDRGAAGEEYVGSLLEGLAQRGWCVMHDASLGRGNVDHILIGPPGVYTVETKSHPGPVRVSRVHGGTLAQVHSQRRLVERVTGMDVEPLLVYSRAWVDRPLARRKGVRVIPAGMLVGYLERRPQRLRREQIDQAHLQVSEALRRRALRTRIASPRGLARGPGGAHGVDVRSGR